MPRNVKDYDNFANTIQLPGCVTVRCGPCSGALLNADKIPLDGRIYICAGKVFLKNGVTLRANFEIQTHTFDYLDRDTVYVLVEDAWYKFDEEELYTKLGIQKSDALPFTWLPDIPLDSSDKGPYRMYFHEPHNPYK